MVGTYRVGASISKIAMLVEQSRNTFSSQCYARRETAGPADLTHPSPDILCDAGTSPLSTYDIFYLIIVFIFYFSREEQEDEQFKNG